MACDAATVATDASCFTCQGEKQLLGMQVYLLAQLLKLSDPMADISPAAIAAASNCYTCYLSGKGLLGAAVYLLCQITDNGGTGSSDGTTNMALGGVAPPVDGSITTYRVFDTDTAFSWYNSGTIAAPTWNNV